MSRQFPIADLGASLAVFDGQGLLVETPQSETPDKGSDEKIRDAIYTLYECLDTDSVELVINHLKEYELPELAFEAEQGLKDTDCPHCEGGGWTMVCYGGAPVAVECDECGNPKGLPSP